VKDERMTVRKEFDKAILLVALYVVGCIASVGVATADTERHGLEKKAACEARVKAGDTSRTYCEPMPPAFEGVLKGVLWPFWVSYKIADSLMTSNV
jgi:hypothetical protein